MTEACCPMAHGHSQLLLSPERMFALRTTAHCFYQTGLMTQMGSSEVSLHTLRSMYPMKMFF